MIVGILEKKHLVALLQNEQRIDNRPLFSPREFNIETNVINRAEGSAKIQLGKTTVYAGVKAELGTPFPDTPDKGVLIVNVELSPIASPYFESGPPSKNAIEMARVCDRSLRESHTIDLEKLCIIPGEKVWIIFVDIYTVADDGNLLDASSLAAMAALANCQIPIVKVDPESNQITKMEEKEALPLNTYSTTMTFSKIGDKILLDPVLAEEKIEDVRFTVGLTQDGIITAIQKSLPAGLTRDEIDILIDTAVTEGLLRIQELKDKI